MTKNAQNESYRDKISTVDREGKRIWIYPQKPEGPFYKARTWVSVLLLAILVITPFIKINGKPMILLNFLERKFILFGVGFWPQDFHLFVIATIALIVFVVLFTVTFGRIFCGWICPQTIFMEMVFRKIEYWIEGDARQQKKLNTEPMHPGKFLKKAIKHGLFYIIAFLIGNLFLSYIIGMNQLLEIIADPISEHGVGFLAMILFSGAFYFNFAFFREQACTLVCPYGRFQSVLLDAKTIVVAYDFKRGEPRGKIKRGEDDSGKGDCINCENCIRVCPTGIDIRNGTQLECVNCTACIDACNSVMARIKKPKGLIRYASYDGIKTGELFRFTPRIIGYTTVLILLLVVLSTLIFLRKPIETTILRTPGVLYQELPDGRILNLYNLKIINKTFEQQKISLHLKKINGEIEMIGGNTTIPEGELLETSFFIKIPEQNLKAANTVLEIEVSSHGGVFETVKTSFMGPNPYTKIKGEK